MTRMYKKQERRNRSPRKHRPPAEKTGSKKDNLPAGYKEHTNALEAKTTTATFIPKIR